MDIVIIGPGRIGSTFAFHLALAGHRVAVVARGTRLETLRREGAIVTVDGRRAPVLVLSEFDAAAPADLVIVTMPASQAETWRPRLAASAARAVLPLFNSFDGTRRWREALGEERFAFGFPNMIAFLDDRGRLRSRVDGPGMVTTLTSARWAGVFAQAGLPTEVEPDMDAFLRSHAAMVAPVFVSAQLTWRRGHGLTWAEARRLADALAEGLALVGSLGHPLKPRMIAMLARRSRLTLTAMMWLVGRLAATKDLGEFGPDEARQLIDAMVALAPDRTRALQAIRP